MLIVKVKNNKSIEESLKKMKYKIRKTKLVDQLRDRKQFKKSSVKRREEIQKAMYVQTKHNDD